MKHKAMLAVTYSAGLRADKYMMIEELKQTFQLYLGDKVKIRRLVFWRYLAIYRKSELKS